MASRDLNTVLGMNTETGIREDKTGSRVEWAQVIFPKGRARGKRRINVVYRARTWNNTTLYHRSIDDVNPQKRDYVYVVV